MNKEIPKLPEGVVDIASIATTAPVDGCRIFTHYNGPTDQLNGLCVGMAVLDPGSTPHPPHRHAEEEFLIVASGDGEIYVEGKTTQVGPGAIMYVAGRTEHGIRNTGNVSMTFYWSKWLVRKTHSVSRRDVDGAIAAASLEIEKETAEDHGEDHAESRHQFQRGARAVLIDPGTHDGKRCGDR